VKLCKNETLTFRFSSLTFFDQFNYFYYFYLISESVTLRHCEPNTPSFTSLHLEEVRLRRTGNMDEMTGSGGRCGGGGGLNNKLLHFL
jgi:hypothetical protein